MKKPLGQRLAELANRQREEREWKKNHRSWNPQLAHIKSHKQYNEWIKTPEGQNYLKPKTVIQPEYQTTKNNTKKATKINCGPKPLKFIGTKKNPDYAIWQTCNAARAAGGARRKTRRGKKSRRMTRRH
jgi:hypothetical protein